MESSCSPFFCILNFKLVLTGTATRVKRPRSGNSCFSVPIGNENFHHLYIENQLAQSYMALDLGRHSCLDMRCDLDNGKLLIAVFRN